MAQGVETKMHTYCASTKPVILGKNFATVKSAITTAMTESDYRMTTAMDNEMSASRIILSPVDKQRHRDSYQGLILNIRPLEGKLMSDKVSFVSELLTK